MLLKSPISLALAASVAASVAAQAASSTATATGTAANPSISAILGTLSPCVLACLNPAAEQNNCTLTDVACVCSSSQFVLDATKCLTDHCTDADIDSANSLQASQCGLILPTSIATIAHPVSFTLASSTAGATGVITTAPASSTPTSPATVAAGTSAPVATTAGNGAQSLSFGVAGLLAAVVGVLTL